MKTKLKLLAICHLLAAICLSASAQGTVFTYQGRLNDGANPANGKYDLTFALFSVVSGAGQVGSTLTNSTTGVSNGLFTVTLDFGNQFPGANRWLEIAVRTNGGGAFTTLTPRQPITATPYAITAGAVTGPINGGLITAGSVTSNYLAGGGLVLSATENTALVNAGYVKLGKTATADVLQLRGNGTPPDTRNNHTAVWTGSEMIVWGGSASGPTFFNDTLSYTPGRVRFLYQRP